MLVYSWESMIQLRDALPDGILYEIDRDSRILQIFSIRHLFADKRVILLGISGAFTPTCSVDHIPGFITKANDLHAKGITDIYCLTVNDPFVVYQWSKTFPSNERIRFLADGSATFTKAIGMDIDMTDARMGIRGRRYVLFVENMVVRKAIVEGLDGTDSTLTVEDVLKLFI